MGFSSVIPGMSQPDLIKLWEEHTAHEFVTGNTESTLDTMVEYAYVNHIPTMTGGYGKAWVQDFLCVFSAADGQRRIDSAHSNRLYCRYLFDANSAFSQAILSMYMRGMEALF